ncbi:MAG: putative transport system permease protein [Nocardioidaceae bacterium]|nr:putative transport system permease protein [Nocardioidaceae bacterium]
MLTITLGDLRFRAARFAVAILAAAVVFALAVLLSGLAATFDTEIATTVSDAGADAWVVAAGAPGPLTAFEAMDQAVGDQLLAAGGATAVDPLIFIQQAATPAEGPPTNVNLIAHRPGGLGAPTLREGTPIAAPGEIVVDEELEAALGETITIGTGSFRVVGLTSGHRMFAGLPNVYLAVADAQASLFGGAPIVSAFLTTGVPTAPPPGVRVMSNDEVRADTSRVLGNAVQSVKMMRALMWMVAALIVAALVYITALERTRDFAVLKAMGSRSGLPVGSLVAQAVIVTVLAAVAAMVLSKFLRPAFQLPLTVPFYAYRDIVAVALVVGALSSLAGARRAVSVDPALAFGG